MTINLAAKAGGPTVPGGLRQGATLGPAVVARLGSMLHLEAATGSSAKIVSTDRLGPAMQSRNLSGISSRERLGLMRELLVKDGPGG